VYVGPVPVQPFDSVTLTVSGTIRSGSACRIGRQKREAHPGRAACAGQREGGRAVRAALREGLANGVPAVPFDTAGLVT